MGRKTRTNGLERYLKEPLAEPRDWEVEALERLETEPMPRPETYLLIHTALRLIKGTRETE